MRYLSSFSLDQSYNLTEGILIFLEEISNGNGDTSTDSDHTMYEDIGFLPRFFDEVIGEIEVLTDLKIFVIFDGEI
jgi:hypothetical protein